MSVRNAGGSGLPGTDADQALEAILERVSEYVVLTPRDTSMPIPLVGILGESPRVELADRRATPAEQAVRVWRKIGGYLWWALPPRDELPKSLDREAE